MYLGERQDYDLEPGVLVSPFGGAVYETRMVMEVFCSSRKSFCTWRPDAIDVVWDATRFTSLSDNTGHRRLTPDHALPLRHVAHKGYERLE